jgi:hypothetical protein
LLAIPEAALVTAFDEWMRRYREDPSRFRSDWLACDEPGSTYGEVAARYLISILAERLGGRVGAD